VFGQAIGQYTPRGVRTDDDEIESLNHRPTPLVRGEDLDAIAYSCTSGTLAIGEQVVMELIQSARPGVPVTTPFTGAIAALKRLAVERITFLTPYLEEVTAVMRTAIEDRGFQVVRTVSMDLSLDSQICRVAPATLSEVDTADSQALFISCTALMTSPVIAGIEASIGKPVVTSNQALRGTHSDCRVAITASPASGD
jgi:maleate isomerase